MFQASARACGGYRHGVWTAPEPCPARPVAAGLRIYTEPKVSVWWAFACAEHAEHLTAARPLLDRDHAEIARRRAAAPAERVTPLAVGRAARDLVDRAQRWAAAHRERSYTPTPTPTPTPSTPATGAPARGTAGNPFAGYARNDPPDRPAT